MIVQFKTPGEIPLDAFSLLGINVKHSPTAIGRFGTGLKYAVAVILRHGGEIKLFINMVEYEFYLAKKDFRGKTFQQVRMRKRGGLGKWLTSKALPFTTEFGKDWGLWQAYRELESNTRDEDGVTSIGTDMGIPARGTLIHVDCPGFHEHIEKAEAFLPEEKDRGNRVYSGPMVDIYDRPSKHLYYQGIRVFDLRYPARMTYDFKAPYVQLTEDRTAANSWNMMYHLAMIFQKEVTDRSILYKALSKTKDEDRWNATFETMDLNFDYTEEGSDSFALVAHRLTSAGSGGRSISGYYGSHSSYSSLQAEKSVSLPRLDWDNICTFIKEVRGQIDSKSVEASVDKLMAKIRPFSQEIPF